MVRPGAQDDGGERHPMRAAAGVLLLVALLALNVVAFAPSLDGPFVFDDLKSVGTIAGLPDAGARVRWALGEQRPLTELTLVMNHEAAGRSGAGSLPRARAFRLTNIALHALAAWLLLLIVRWTILHTQPGWTRHGATGFALVAASAWSVHPLQAQSACYVIQRAEVLAGLLSLATLLCVIRSDASRRPWAWWALAALAMALGMASKAVVVALPAAVLLYDVVFLAGSLGGAVRKRWLLYAALCVTWSMLWITGVASGLAGTGAAEATVGFGVRGAAWWQYAMTQPGVIAHYLWAMVYPPASAFDYAWPIETSPAAALVRGVPLALLLVVGAWGVVRRRWWGFACLVFFVLLSPTSSVVPVRDAAFDHRVYLAMAGVVVLAVAGGAWLIRRLAGTGAGGRRAAALASVVVVAGLVFMARDRASDFRGREALWGDTVARRPDNVRARVQLAVAMQARGDIHGAIAQLDEALARDPSNAGALYNKGVLLDARGDTAGAEACYRGAVASEPAMIPAQDNLSKLLIRTGRQREAIEVLEAAREIPRRRRYRVLHAGMRANLGILLIEAGRREEAEAVLREALEIVPDHDLARRALESIAGG